MGRIYVELDPPGYFRVDEPGWHFSWTGRQILEHFAGGGIANGYAAGAYNPPGTDWVMPRLKQMNADHYKSAAIEDTLLAQAQWTFAAGLSPTSYEPSKVGGETNHPSNQWVSIPYVPAGTASLDSTAYGALGLAAGLDLTDFVTVALTGSTPVGGMMEEQFHPYAQFLIYPEPYNRVVFGWGRFAFILTGPSWIMAEASDGGRQVWRVIAAGEVGGAEAKAAVRNSGASANFLMTSRPAAIKVEVVVIPIGEGPREVLVSVGTGGTWGAATPVRLATPLTSLSSTWWLGAEPGSHVNAQVQVVAYNDLTLLNVAGQYLFDLGGDYLPTEDPSIAVYGVMNLKPDQSDLSIAQTSNQYVAASNFTNQTMQATLRDGDDALWLSDGTNTRGNVWIILVAGNAGVNGDYMTPMVRRVEVRFPPKLVARENTLLRLDDTEFQGWVAETGLRDPLAKSGEVRIFDAALALLSSGGVELAHRDSYPVHITEDVDNDGTPETIRAAGWVTEPRRMVIAAEDTLKADGGSWSEPVEVWAIGFGPLLHRTDQQWVYLPQMVSPESPHVEHGYAIRETLFQAAFDVADADRVFLHTDPFAGSDISRLPGGPADQTGSGASALTVEAPYLPRDNQTLLAYMEMIAAEWSAWLLYEGLTGKVFYHPDLVLEALLADLSGGGLAYFRSATVYLRHSDALAAGVPDQCAEAQGFDWSPQPPVCNLVRVNGTDLSGGALRGVMDKRSVTWTAGNQSNEDFFGSIKPRSIEAKLAVSIPAAMKIARFKCYQGSRRRQVWQAGVWLAPWEFDSGSTTLDVGKVVNFDGRGDHLITHLRAEQIARGVFRTRITGEKLPGTMTQAGSAGAYPGVGA